MSDSHSRTTNENEKDAVHTAVRITTVLNKHLQEDDCHHTVKEIAAEAFE